MYNKQYIHPSSSNFHCTATPQIHSNRIHSLSPLPLRHTPFLPPSRQYRLLTLIPTLTRTPIFPRSYSSTVINKYTMTGVTRHFNFDPNSYDYIE